MSTSTITTIGKPVGRIFALGCAPLRFLRSLLLREETANGGPNMTTELMAEGLAAESEELAATAGEAGAIERLVDKMRRHWTDFWADGVIDARERRILAADQRALAQQTRSHAQHLEDLR